MDCLLCSQQVTPNLRGRKRRYCSDQCKGRDNYRKRCAIPERQCITCGKTYSLPSRQKYCSDECKNRRGRFKSLYAIVQKTNGRCALCHDPVDLSLRSPDPMSRSVDHIIPLAKGGTDDLSNLQLTHLGCNWDKGSTDVSMVNKEHARRKAFRDRLRNVADYQCYR